MLIKGISLAGCAIAAVLSGQPQAQPLFTQEEKNAIIHYWSDSARYSERLPADADKNGPFQVRLSVPGSIWLREYNRLRGLNKVPPTTTAKPQNEEQEGWQQWIDAKIEHDRWNAAQVASDSNRRLLGHDGKLDDRTLPKTEPPDPGPAPEALVAFAGDPPVFADAVVPMLHEVAFDDGTKIAFTDNRRMRKNYAYYRFESGVASEGVDVKKVPDGRLKELCEKAGITDSELRVMKAVSMLEGGFDAVNTYDTGYVSVGFIQFATLKDGGNSLGDMLKLYKDQDPEDFQKDFRRYGIDVTPDAKLACLDPSTGAELTGEAAVHKVIDDKRLIAVFQYDGLKSDAYNAMQIRSAKEQFYPGDDAVTLNVNGKTLTGKVSDIFKSEAGMATLMDRKVNTGHLDLLKPVLEQFAEANGVSSVADLSKYEYDIVAAMQYRRDYLRDESLSQPLTTVRSKPLSSRSGNRSGRGGGKKNGGHTDDPNR
ncbi:MAG TPA: hypothetical protein VHE55_01795 [Fimbriimonadaceae bacterium]|nr:hypothetical protein [Fimbriimonadaceae bacterium]